MPLQSAQGPWRRGLVVLLTPVVLTYVGLLIAPLLLVLEESFRLYVPGRVGSASDAPHTLANYTEFLEPSYASFFWTTIRLSAIAAFICTVLGLPTAYLISRARSALVRNGLLTLMIVIVFLSALVRVYAIQLTLGPTGLLRPVLTEIGLTLNSRAYLEASVVAGLLHFMFPIATLTLVGALRNINPSLLEAAESLGATRSWAHLTITVPLSVPGIVSAFLIAFSGSISAFVVPLILGKGRILFISNLIYNRFNELANYPSGAALSILLLLIASFLVFFATQASSRYGRSA